MRAAFVFLTRMTVGGFPYSSADFAWAPAHFPFVGLVVGGVSATSLAERHGTPLLVVDELDLRERARRVRAAFTDPLYAVKAFTSSAVVRIVLEEDLGLLAATGGEVEACLRAGAPASRIVMHGNAKTDEELELAVGAGLRLVVADGLDELERLDAVARERRRVQPVLLRVVPDVEVETHEAIATGHDASKFGTSLPAVADEALQSLGTAVVPLCLTLIGMSLAYYGWPRTWRGLAGLVATKLLLMPAVVFAIGHWGLGLTGMPLAVIVMIAALPTGSNALIFAQRYRALEAEVTAATVVSTGLYVATAPLWLALLAWLSPWQGP